VSHIRIQESHPKKEKNRDFHTMKRYLKGWFHWSLKFSLVEGGLSLKPPSTRSKELSRVPKRRKIFCCKIVGRKP
jgi:hypothetical protein